MNIPTDVSSAIKVYILKWTGILGTCGNQKPEAKQFTLYLRPIKG